MATYAYSPYTLEHISTTNPSEWMGLTQVEPPTYDAAVASCFWRSDHWEVVAAQPEAKPVPAAVTMRQARLALLQEGKLTQVNAAIASLLGADGEKARIEWEFAGHVARDNSLAQSIGALLGLNGAQLDDLFRSAALL